MVLLIQILDNEQVLETIGRQKTQPSHHDERAYRNRPLTDVQKAENRERSRIRAKVEHVFDRWIMTIGGKLVRTIGIDPVTVQLGLKHLTYNFKRWLFWQAQSVPAV